MINIFISNVNNNIRGDWIMEKKIRNHAKTFKAFQTSAISEIDKRMRESQVSIPSEEAVIEAKEWVDNNKK